MSDSMREYNYPRTTGVNWTQEGVDLAIQHAVQRERARCAAIVRECYYIADLSVVLRRIESGEEK